MKISELDQARLTKWSTQRVPEHARHQVTVRCVVHGGSAVITEERAPWDGVGDWTSRPVARLRNTDQGWLIDGADRNGHWRLREDLSPVPSLEAALAVLDDQRHAFWG